MSNSVSDTESVGLVDTNVIILRRWINPDDLPDALAISSVTLAELSAGIHAIADPVDETAERARRLDVLQRTEHEFDPLPFDAASARIYGRIAAAVIATGRKPRRRVADLMIASVAAANNLDLYTTNPDDYRGLDEVVNVVPVPRPVTGDLP
jgi:predicted nucleic acid-binding protein